MEGPPVPKAWVWIDKPMVRVVLAPWHPLPEPWWSTFRAQGATLRCLGTSRSGQPCKRAVYEWHTPVPGTSPPFVAYCRAHRGPDQTMTWRLWRIAQHIPCLCGCGATVLAEGSALTENPPHTDNNWHQIVAALGSGQWISPSSVWTAWMTAHTSLAWTTGIEGALDATAYRAWLYDGPASLWDHLPEAASANEPLT